jgi:hypothetical protein
MAARETERFVETYGVRAALVGREPASLASRAGQGVADRLAKLAAATPRVA